jgi:hypothetical protein
MVLHNSPLAYPNEYFRLYEHCKVNPTFRDWNNQVVSFGRRITDLDERNKFYGDMLEVLSELFFNIMIGNPRFSLSEYTPIGINEDYGVDATGINVNKHKCAVQVKFRHNPNDLITYTDIAKTFTSAVCQFDMLDVVNHDHTIFLFTNVYDVSRQFKEVLQKKAVVLNNAIISQEIDNNRYFWETAYNMIFNKLDE